MERIVGSLPSYWEKFHWGICFLNRLLFHSLCITLPLQRSVFCHAPHSYLSVLRHSDNVIVLSWHLWEIGKILFITFIGISVMVIMNFIPLLSVYKQISFLCNIVFMLSSLLDLRVFISRAFICLADSDQVDSSVA